MIVFGRKESLDLLKAWLLISLAFTVLIVNPLFNYSTLTSSKLIITFFIALGTAGIGFLLHELGHRIVAHKFGCRAEFKADNFMLVLALIMSVFGLIFAAPGAVVIRGYLTKKQNGIIAAAGPLMNLFLALAFLPGIFLLKGIIGDVFSYGFMINAWLGLFNMIPVGPFDGQKIYAWNKPIFFTMAIILLVLSLLSLFI